MRFLHLPAPPGLLWVYPGASLQLKRASLCRTVEKLRSVHGNHAKYRTSLRNNDTQFTIYHYAGPVSYSTDAFLEANRDKCEDLARLLLSAASPSWFSLDGLPAWADSRPMPLMYCAPAHK
jgi:hypothetical protein